MIQYKGRYGIFDANRVHTYPLATRKSKTEVDSFVDPADLARGEPIESALPWFRDGRPGDLTNQTAGLDELARHTVRCAAEGKPVMALCGAHFIKGGLSPLIIDLMNRDILSLFGGNGACAIHSFEFALTGASSESVRESLPAGDFGMAFETGAYLNAALEMGSVYGVGFGESMGLLYCDTMFRSRVLDSVFERYPSNAEYLKPYDGFPYVDTCVFAAGYRKGIPVGVHASIGTDIIDQHPGFDGGSKGQASGLDFLILAETMSRCQNGGVILNIGSAVMGPEVALKAASMAANVGRRPDNLWTADFDLRPFGYSAEEDEETPAYYFRDQKSIATRIPQSFGGRGYYFEGPLRTTLSAFYQRVVANLGSV